MQENTPLIDESVHKNVQDSVNILCQTAVQAVATLDEYGEMLVQQLEKTAEAIVSTFNPQENTMAEFRSKVEAAKELQLIPSKVPTKKEISNTIDMIYAMCDVQQDVKTVMLYVRTAQEVIFVWYPDEIVA